MTQLPTTFLVCFCMSTFIRLVFSIPDSVLDARIYPQASHNQGMVRGSCSLGAGEPGAGSNPGTGHALVPTNILCERTMAGRAGSYWQGPSTATDRTSDEPGPGSSQEQKTGQERAGDSFPLGVPPWGEPPAHLLRDGAGTGLGTGLSRNRAPQPWPGEGCGSPGRWSGSGWPMGAPRDQHHISNTQNSYFPNYISLKLIPFNTTMKFQWGWTIFN